METAVQNRVSRDTVVIIPAYNEEAAIASLLAELRQFVPGFDVVVVNDGSDDKTGLVAKACGASVLNLPCNLGIGGAVQAGFLYAFEQGYRYVVRCDGDGQHPPSEIPRLVAAMKEGDADLVVGSRFLGVTSYTSTFFRQLGIRGLAAFLSLICRKRVTDPTSGFFLLNRRLLYFFAHRYPTDYPEPEALALLRRQGYTFKEVPVTFRARATGHSSIRTWGAFYYLFKVGLALVVDRARRMDVRFARANVSEKI